MERLLPPGIHCILGSLPKEKTSKLGTFLFLALLFVISVSNTLLAITSISPDTVCIADGNATLSFTISSTTPNSFLPADTSMALNVEYLVNGTSTSSTTTSPLDGGTGAFGNTNDFMVRVDQNYLSSTQYQIRVSPAVTNVSATSPVFTITGLQIEDVVDESGTSYALNHQFCPGDYLGVEFDMNNAPNAGNYYIAEISNNNFTTSTTIGQIPSVATSGTIPAIIPYDAAPGTGYVLRIRATDPELGDSEDYTTDYDILIDPTITTQPAAQYDVCLGDDVDITVGSNNTNSRQWEKLCLDSFFVTLRDTSALGADAISSVAKSGNNIYVGTFNGLSYYDGSTWSVINTGLSDNQINDVFFDPSTNRVYLSTADGLTILDSDGMNPIVVKPPNIPSNQVNQIYADGNDIYVATSGGAEVFAIQ